MTTRTAAKTSLISGTSPNPAENRRHDDIALRALFRSGNHAGHGDAHYAGKNRKAQPDRVHLCALDEISAHFAAQRIVGNEYKRLRRGVNQIHEYDQHDFKRNACRNEIPREKQKNGRHNEYGRAHEHEETAFAESARLFSVADFPDKRVDNSVPHLAYQHDDAHPIHGYADGKRQKGHEQKVYYVEAAPSEDIAAGKRKFVFQPDLLSRIFHR